MNWPARTRNERVSVLLHCGIDAETDDMGLLSAARLRSGRRNRGCIHRECGKSHPVTGALAGDHGVLVNVMARTHHRSLEQQQPKPPV